MRIVVAVGALVALISGAAQAADPLRFEVDAAWPKPPADFVGSSETNQNSL